MRDIGSKICVVMACHNRKQKTLNCLRSLYSQEPFVPFDVLLVDDGSTDGTSEEIATIFPEVVVIPGSGNLFWAGAMRIAFGQALEGDYQGYLWLNDDVELDGNALERLIDSYGQLGGNVIVGGSMRGAQNGEAIYGGNVRVGASPFKYRFVPPPESEALPVSVLHGNLVYIDREVARKVGNVAPYLTHLWGDFEYSLRATRLGVRSFIAPGTYGVCAGNSTPAKRRGMAGLKRILSEKQMPFASAVPLYREYAGPLWPVWLASPYVKAFIVGY